MGNGWVEWTAVMEGFGQDCSLWGAWLVHDSLWLNLSFAEAFAFVQGFFALHQWSDSSASYCSVLEQCPRALFYAHACDPNKPHSLIFYYRTPPQPLAHKRSSRSSATYTSNEQHVRLLPSRFKKLSSLINETQIEKKSREPRGGIDRASKDFGNDALIYQTRGAIAVEYDFANLHRTYPPQRAHKTHWRSSS